MADKSESKKWQVFIVDNHPLIRETLASLVERKADSEVCGAATVASAALPLISQCEPDLVVLDVSSKGLDLLKALKELLCWCCP